MLATQSVAEDVSGESVDVCANLETDIATDVTIRLATMDDGSGNIAKSDSNIIIFTFLYYSTCW